ncbi:hypothetical protein MAPG_03576 [Magnaporthiopsis poae ATCC 64411]|uniref:Uncharacterized protein n=1 Tax=Magnaporthiopsis poae (strain ATCC 64411 / 73-15) TaxID=644358 RepID=A0A0C4DUD6_MAGP6|nr:hypothetical protein MAPG_03576 [Magnaporthiopsis poae ATCC 64411]
MASPDPGGRHYRPPTLRLLLSASLQSAVPQSPLYSASALCFLKRGLRLALDLTRQRCGTVGNVVRRYNASGARTEKRRSTGLEQEDGKDMCRVASAGRVRCHSSHTTTLPACTPPVAKCACQSFSFCCAPTSEFVAFWYSLSATLWCSSRADFSHQTVNT